MAKSNTARLGPIEKGLPKKPDMNKWGGRLESMSRGDSFLVEGKSKSHLHYLRVVAARLRINISLQNELTDNGIGGFSRVGVRVFHEGKAK